MAPLSHVLVSDCVQLWDVYSEELAVADTPIIYPLLLPYLMDPVVGGLEVEMGDGVQPRRVEVLGVEVGDVEGVVGQRVYYPGQRVLLEYLFNNHYIGGIQGYNLLLIYNSLLIEY